VKDDAQSKRVVIVGGGFAGAYAAQRLARHARRLGLDVTLVNRTNYFIFYPLLVEAGTGSLEPRHAVVPLRRMIDHGRFLMADVTDIDLEAQRVHAVVRGGETHSLPYDHVIITPGSVTLMPPVPGLAEHGLQMKSMADAVGLRDRAIQLLEVADTSRDVETRRRLLRFVVVGGAYTGVEVAGELDVFLHEASQAYENIRSDEIRVTLVEKEARLLPQVDRGLADYAMEQLRRRGIDLRLETTVGRVDADAVELSDGERIPTRTCLWTAGIQPPGLIDELDVPTDERGYVLCEPTLQVEGREHVWAVGDAAINPDPDGRPYPATAQHAVQEGRAAADNILRVIGGSSPEPFVYRPKGSIAPLGCRSGVAEVFGFRISGFFAWWLYRTVYLMKMPGVGRRVRIALDWTIGLFFGRDSVQLGVHHPTSGSRAADS